MVWCPKTKNKTWVMRQNGKVMITGNCEINAPRYVRLIRNLPAEGEGHGRLAKVFGKKTVGKGTTLILKASMLYAAVMLFNATFFPDEEEELGESHRRQLHLILGRNPDGTIRTMRFQGALSDALSWFGGEDIVSDVKDLAQRKKTFKEKGGEALLAPIIKIIHGIRPDMKVAAEMLSGRSFYPDPFFPRPIRDKWEHIARLFSLNAIYKAAVGKPRRGMTAWDRLQSDIMSLGFYTSDPGESAYYDVKKWSYDYLEDEGVEKPGIIPTTRSNALYYYKQALKYGDLQAAARYLKKYEELGGTEKGRKISVKASMPLGSLPKKMRKGFKESLDKKQLETLNKAEEWYNRTYKEGKKTSGIPSRPQGFKPPSYKPVTYKPRTLR